MADATSARRPKKTLTDAMLITYGPSQVGPWSGLFLDVEDLLLYLE